MTTLSLILAACASSPSEPVAPPAGVTPMPPPGAGVSVLTLPLHFDFAALEQAVDAAVPTQFSAEQDWQPAGKAGIKYAWQRDAIAIRVLDPATLTVETTVRYRAKVAVHLSGGYQQLTQCGYGEAEPSLEHVGLRLHIAATGWKLTPDPSVEQPTPGVPCKVVLHIDASEEIARQLFTRLQEKLDASRQRLGQGLDLSTAAAGIWDKLSEPYAFGGAEPGYLSIGPRQATLGFVSGADGGLSLLIGISAAPVVAFGPPPAAVPAPPPALEFADPGEGTRIVLPIQVPYTALQQTLSAAMVGKEYSLGSDKEKLDQVTVYASTQSIVLKLTLSGSAQDTLYLKGKAVYDSATGEVSLGDFDYTLDTSNRLQHAEEWLLHSKLKEDLQAQARVKLSERLEKLRATLQGALNRPLGEHAALSGQVDQLQTLGVVLSDTYMTVYLAAQGQLRVDAQ